MKTLLLLATVLCILSEHPNTVTAAPLPTDLKASCFDVSRSSNVVHLIYGQRDSESGLQLFHQTGNATGNDWSAPISIPVSHAPPGSLHRGNDPQIAVSGNHVMAVWTAKGDGPYGSGEIGIALSDDGGRTWRPGPTPRAAGVDDKTGYRFPAAAAGSDGFHLVWIHARGSDQSKDHERSLRHIRLAYGAKSWSDPSVIDSACCACCWNVMKIDASGKIWVLYRDEEPRDLSLASSTDGGKTWRRHGSVGQFNWKFVGCPHVGGGLDLARAVDNPSGLLVASIWTGHTTEGAAYALTSHDGGKTWPTPVSLSSDGAVGRHTDAATIPGEHAAAVWDQVSSGETSVHLRQTADAGKTWSASRRLSKEGHSSMHPRLVAGDGNFLVFYTETLADNTQFLKLDVVPSVSITP